MLYSAIIDEIVSVKPKYLGPKFADHIRLAIEDTAAEKLFDDIGFVVFVIDVIHRSRAQVQDSSGNLVIPLKFEALVFKPSVDEILDAVIQEVTPLGFFAHHGSYLEIFVRLQPGGRYTYEQTKNSFSDKDKEQLTLDSCIRVKIINVKLADNKQKYFGLGTIEGGDQARYLGVISQRSLGKAETGYFQAFNSGRPL